MRKAISPRFAMRTLSNTAISVAPPGVARPTTHETPEEDRRLSAHCGPSRLSCPQRSFNAKDAKFTKNARKTLSFLCDLCVLCELCVPLHGGKPSAEQPL